MALYRGRQRPPREHHRDWALRQFQERYGEGVRKWDIFYAMLHYPQERERYADLNGFRDSGGI